MAERDRLIELIDGFVFGTQIAVNSIDWDSTKVKELADFLISNGVIVPPVKVGDIVYFIYEEYDEEGCNICILECKIEELGVDNISGWFRLKLPIGIKLSGYFRNNKLGHNIFLTREEAEQALKERSENDA